MDDGSNQLFAYIFPFAVIGAWLAASFFFGLLTGWFELQKRYPVGNDEPLLKLRFRSGSMGMFVGLNGVLSLCACRSGLRVGITRVFGPLQRSFQVPWKEIIATPTSSFFTPSIELTFGRPEVGRMKIDARAWQRLREAAASGMAANVPPADLRVTRLVAAKARLLQWAIFAGGAGSFFYLAPRLLSTTPAPPIALCFGFPAAIFGVGAVVGFLRDG